MARPTHGCRAAATGKRFDEQQTKKRLSEIADTVGRPVTKVILDREDKVVLNFGDIITHQAIQRAHESGGLDSLLSSAYKGTVVFTKEDMRAPMEVEVEATVDKSSFGAAIVDELETKVEVAEKERQAGKEEKKIEDDAKRQSRKAERETRERERETAKNERESGSAKEAPPTPVGKTPIAITPERPKAASGAPQTTTE